MKWRVIEAIALVLLSLALTWFSLNWGLPSKVGSPFRTAVCFPIAFPIFLATGSPEIGLMVALLQFPLTAIAIIVGEKGGRLRGVIAVVLSVYGIGWTLSFLYIYLVRIK